MKKIYLGIILTLFAVVNALAVNVSVTMNGTSRTMTLVKKENSSPIAIGEPTSYKYVFDIEPGSYILTGHDSNADADGSIEIEVTDAATQEFKITTISAVALNADWVLNTDYELDCAASSKEGIVRQISTVTKTTSIYGKNYLAKRFLMYVGDSYRLDYTVSSTRVEEGYLDTFNHSNTVTATTVNAAITIPEARTYSITVPKDASLYVGGKRGAIVQSSGGTHYVPFIDMNPVNSTTNGDKTTYTYSLGKGCTYNYRVSQPGKLTNGGIFTMTTNVAPLEVTKAMMDLQSPNYINHKTADNQGANVADILMNINKEGHLKMKSGDTHQLLNLRSWQLTDNSTNNYFIEPDYHYTILGLDGKPSNSVVEIDENRVIKTKGKGTAILQITYDAIYLQVFNTSQTETTNGYYYGPLWSAIWPENTGTFVVTVDEGETSIVRNMNIQEEQREDGASITVDAEHDIFYYKQGTEGYSYTFKPEGVASVSIANPTLETNISTYSGFENITTNEDGSYTVLLKYGRNIIKLTASNGASEYQTITAKPVSYEVKNATNPGEKIQPGDRVEIQFDGFYHPANKLAGIYNMSAYIVYNGVPNGTSLILSPNQYQFAGDPRAQVVNIEIPNDWDTQKTFDLEQGALQIKGYGSVIGKHRDISVVTGINPNFTAEVRVQYFGGIPDISIPVNATNYYEVSFSGIPEGVSFSVYDRDNVEVTPVEGLKYSLPFGPYSYVAKGAGYRVLRSGFAISSKSPESQVIPISLETIAPNGWDGVTQTQPVIVSAGESNTSGGDFEGMEGYYKISSGYELAWFANAINTGNPSISAIQVNDVDLAGFDWTPIGKNANNQRLEGQYDGGVYKVNDLYINSTATYQGLFGYISAATIKNITVEGSVKSTNGYVGGIIGGSIGTSTLENCYNHAVVSGKQYVGGIIGYSGSAPLKILNCHNTAEITGSTTYIGGVIGSLQGGTATFSNVSNTGNVTSAGAYVGGIAGSSSSATITNAANIANITGFSTSYIGGITGSGSNPITNVFHIGNIVTNYANYIGGAINGTTNQPGALVNAYVLDASFVDAPTEKTIEEFASGEVAALLGSAFGQEIGTDNYPILGGKAVYKVSYSNNLNNEVSVVYTNGELPTITKDGYSYKWLNRVGGTEVNTVTENADLYVHFVNDGTSINEEKETLAVYPNPFVDYIIVNSNNNDEAVLYDIAGKSVYKLEIKVGENRIETNDLPKGSYILKTRSSFVKLMK